MQTAVLPWVGTEYFKCVKISSSYKFNEMPIKAIQLGIDGTLHFNSFRRKDKLGMKE